MRKIAAIGIGVEIREDSNGVQDMTTKIWSNLKLPEHIQTRIARGVQRVLEETIMEEDRIQA